MFCLALRVVSDHTKWFPFDETKPGDTHLNFNNGQCTPITNRHVEQEIRIELVCNKTFKTLVNLNAVKLKLILKAKTWRLLKTRLVEGELRISHLYFFSIWLLLSAERISYSPQTWGLITPGLQQGCCADLKHSSQKLRDRLHSAKRKAEATQ